MFTLKNKTYKVIETNADFNSLKCVVTVGLFENASDESPTEKSLCIVPFSIWTEHTANLMELYVQTLPWLPYAKEGVYDLLLPDKLPPTTEEILAEARLIRNRLLLNCDWVFGNDSPLTLAQQEPWRAYRQALRDITNTFPVVWPLPPSAY